MKGFRHLSVPKHNRSKFTKLCQHTFIPTTPDLSAATAHDSSSSESSKTLSKISELSETCERVRNHVAAVPAQPRPDLEVSSLDRMHCRTLFPAAMQPTMIDPITATTAHGGWADAMHTNSTTDPIEISLRYPTQNPPAGTESYLRGRANLPSAARVKCAHAPARCTKYGREVAPCADDGHGLTSPSRICISTIGQFSSHKTHFPEQGWPARINLPFRAVDRGLDGSSTETSALP